MNETAVVYYRPGCPFGIKLRALMALHEVPFTAVPLRTGQEEATRVRAATGGREISPTVLVRGRWLVNPTWREVAITAHR